MRGMLGGVAAQPAEAVHPGEGVPGGAVAEHVAASAVQYRLGKRPEKSEARIGGSGVDTRYITNEKGERVGVNLDIKEYERLLEALEDLEDLRAANEALATIERGEDEPIPWEQVRDKIGSEHEDPKDS